MLRFSLLVCLLTLLVISGVAVPNFTLTRRCLASDNFNTMALHETQSCSSLDKLAGGAATMHYEDVVPVKYRLCPPCRMNLLTCCWKSLVCCRGGLVAQRLLLLAVLLTTLATWVVWIGHHWARHHKGRYGGYSFVTVHCANVI